MCLFGVPAVRLPREVFRYVTLGGDIEEDPEHAGGTTSKLAWERFGFLLDKLEEVTEAKKVWMSLLILLPPSLNYG